MAELTTWHNLIFLVPGALALVLLLLSSALSVGNDSQPDGSGEADADSDMEHAGDEDGESDEENSVLAGILALLGADKAPLTLVLGILMLCWGFVGYWANQLLAPAIPRPSYLVCVTAPIAAIAAVVVSRTVSGLMARFTPKIETAAVSRASLVGQEARVVYAISENAGRAYYYDSKGILHDVSCRTLPGKRAIPKGEKVLLTGFEETTGSFWAELSPFGVE
jgi:membrane protein implicated in regulation of membrane protease activity